MANGSFGHTAFAADVFARRIVGWACATTMGTRELPLQALEQAISWAASHGGTDGLVHHSDHGARCIGLVYTTGVGEFGMLPSAGTVGDSYGNAMAGSADGACKTELVWRRKPFQDLRDLELATFRWISWWGLEASAPVLGLQDTGTDRNRVLCKPSGASRPTIRRNKNQAISMVKTKNMRNANRFKKRTLRFFEVTWNISAGSEGVIEWTTKNLDFA